MGDMAHARPLYTRALPKIHAQISKFQGVNQAFAWQNLAIAEFGLGQIAQGLDAIAKTRSFIDHDAEYGPELMEFNATLYAEINRPDLAVPLLARALASSGAGFDFGPVLLWLDPSWDPIRHDPGFQALLKKYASHRPPDAVGGSD